MIIENNPTLIFTNIPAATNTNCKANRIWKVHYLIIRHRLLQSLSLFYLDEYDFFCK